MDTPPATDASLARKTTTQDELTTAGQRKVNLIWEYTQAFIAIVLVVSTCVGALRVMFAGGAELQIPNILCALGGTVVGSYFQRTNHMNVGGVGPKPTDNERYVGR